jgi:hypothetical protein
MFVLVWLPLNFVDVLELVVIPVAVLSVDVVVTVGVKVVAVEEVVVVVKLVEFEYMYRYDVFWNDYVAGGGMCRLPVDVFFYLCGVVVDCDLSVVRYLW